MTVKEHDRVAKALEKTQAALRNAAADVERTKAALEAEQADAETGARVSTLAQRLRISEEALTAFVQTIHDLLGEGRSLSVEAARRGALLAAASEAWENEIGPLLGTSQVRVLLGVSRQRVDELMRSKRLIALTDRTGHRRYPAFQFRDGQPTPPLVDAFWAVADAAASPWTAASWCTTEDDALDGLSPVSWAHVGRDPDALARVARHDAARLGG